MKSPKPKRKVQSYSLDDLMAQTHGYTDAEIDAAACWWWVILNPEDRAEIFVRELRRIARKRKGRK